MGKGALDYEDVHALGTVGLQSRDYALAGFEDADVVITVGYDLVEHSPSNWNPKRNKTIICVDSVPSEVDEYFITEIDLVGDLYHILSRLTEELRHTQRTTRSVTAGRHRARPLRGGQGRRRVPDAPAARAVGDPPGARPPRHADLRRRPAQAVDRPHVPGARAEHGADRQRPRGDGDRAADGDRRQARAPRPQRRHGQRRRRLPDERAGARDGRPAQDARSSTSFGRTPNSARSSGSRTRSSGATSGQTSPTPTS